MRLPPHPDLVDHLPDPGENARGSLDACHVRDDIPDGMAHSVFADPEKLDLLHSFFLFPATNV